MYELFVAVKGRKHYLVFDHKAKYEDVVTKAKVYFKCAEKNLEVEPGWLLGDELYLSDPGIKSAKKVTVASHWRSA